MKELERLLNQRMILKAEDKEAYYSVRDKIGEFRKFVSEKLGCSIIENSLLVKLEKIPAIPEPFMGIKDFDSKDEYAIFCIVLMFLEDKDPGQQFVLSQLTEYVAANMPGAILDWTIYTNRRRMIRVLRYAVQQGLLLITDGRDEQFIEDISGEVLYENTGASRYFMRNFSHDIMSYSKSEDFQKSEWYEMDEDRGIARRQRVYKRLLLTPGMYKADGSEEDFEYLKYYGHRMKEELEELFDCQIQIHKSSAFFLSGENCRIGEVFPGNNTLSDIILLCFYEIRKKIEKKNWHVDINDVCVVDRIAFENCIKMVKKRYGQGFSKIYREMPEGEFVKQLVETLCWWSFIRLDESEHNVRIYPIAGKIQGIYPDDYKGEKK